MNGIELFLIAVGLSMDAFAVSICTGLCLKKYHLKKSLIVGLYFGGFQGIMPLIGYFFASQFADKMMAIDHWIAFVLLGIIGGKMLQEGLQKEEKYECKTEPTLGLKEMIPLAIATSIDALAVGVSFAFLKVDIVAASSFIALVTAVFSMIGVKIGNVFGVKLKQKAEIVGGGILIFIGIKILLEHLGIF